MLNTARQALRLREYGIAELAEHIQDLHPERTLNMVNLVERLAQLGEIKLVGDVIGLTDEGERVAALNGARPVDQAGQHRATPPSGEAERRAAITKSVTSLT